MTAVTDRRATLKMDADVLVAGGAAAGVAAARQEQIATFRRDGCVFPIRVLSTSETCNDPSALPGHAA